MTRAKLRVVSIETSLVPRLALVHCEALEGSAQAGLELLTPSGASIFPMSATLGARGQGSFAVCLAFGDDPSILSLASGDLLTGPL